MTDLERIKQLTDDLHFVDERLNEIEAIRFARYSLWRDLVGSVMRWFTNPLSTR